VLASLLMPSGKREEQNKRVRLESPRYSEPTKIICVTENNRFEILNEENEKITVSRREIKIHKTYAKRTTKSRVTQTNVETTAARPEAEEPEAEQQPPNFVGGFCG